MIALSDFAGRGPDKETFAEAVSVVVQQYINEIPAIEIIGVLETAKACVLQQAIDELGGEE
tara:strand:- start:360 stop:542 length:183 start_codon:yes stop_codon:yes gene_type:complete